MVTWPAAVAAAGAGAAAAGLEADAAGAEACATAAGAAAGAAAVEAGADAFARGSGLQGTLAGAPPPIVRVLLSHMPSAEAVGSPKTPFMKEPPAHPVRANAKTVTATRVYMTEPFLVVEFDSLLILPERADIYYNARLRLRSTRFLKEQLPTLR